MENKNELNNAVRYFKERPGLHRMLVNIKGNYQSLNHIGGSVRLTKLSEEEKDQLGIFFQKSLKHQKSLTVQVSKIETQLARTRFGSLSLKEILDAYFGEEITGNRVARENYLEKRETTIKEWISSFPKGKGKSWVQEKLEIDNAVSRYIFQKYKEDENNCFLQLSNLVSVLNRLPYESTHPKKVAQFSAEVTGNPHYFDVGTEGEKWLTFALSSIQGKANKSVKSAEKRSELYFQFGLIRDTLYNFTFCYQIEVYKSGQRLHQGIHGNNLEDEAQIITLETLSQVEEVRCHGGKVYVVENPTVFHSLIKERNSTNPISLVCINGQPNISSLLLLDLIVQSSQSIYYSGDFDPEGLQIGENLKKRYGSALEFWRYSSDDYLAALSKQELTETRLNKLNSLKNEHFIELTKMMKEQKKAGYQESIINLYLEDIDE